MDSDFAQIFQILCQRFPFLKRSLWRAFYEYLASNDWHDDLLFMNYGFADSDMDGHRLILEDQDEKYRLYIQLYHYLVKDTDLKDKDILDVGCGRGGGSFFIMKYHRPKSMTGLDFSEKAISFCKKFFKLPGLSFIHGDAEALPFEENSYDVVINVESSRCYGYIEKFFTGVLKVLRSGGYFLFTDFRHRNELFPLRQKLLDSGMQLVREEMITGQIVNALDLDHERKLSLIRQKAPRFLHKSFESFTGTRGSKIYSQFVNRENEYFLYVLQKPGHSR